jgi:hypothetical protein
MSQEVNAAWDYKKLIPNEGNRFIGFVHPLNKESDICYIEPSTMGDHYFITIIRMLSYAEGTKRPIYKEKIPVYIDYLKFPYQKATWKLEPSDVLINNVHIEESNFKKMSNNDSVYFIQSKIGGPIKIGVAKYPTIRMETIQRMSPFKLQIIGIIRSGGYELEALLHSNFKKYHIHDEWFEDCPEIQYFIDNTCEKSVLKII